MLAKKAILHKLKGKLWSCVKLAF